MNQIWKLIGHDNNPMVALYVKFWHLSAIVLILPFYVAGRQDSMHRGRG